MESGLNESTGQEHNGVMLKSPEAGVVGGASSSETSSNNNNTLLELVVANGGLDSIANLTTKEQHRLKNPAQQWRKSAKEHEPGVTANCNSAVTEALALTAAAAAINLSDGRVEDEGGGDKQSTANGLATPSGRHQCVLNVSPQFPDAAPLVRCALAPTTAAAASELAPDYDAALAGAASLTPPENSHSNRTSINNSTENLSYSSDNFYADDLILLDDDGDIEAEEISLNSDDCVYAYRGDGADFDVALDAYAGRTGGGGGGGIGCDVGGAMDDETDFLEMDFEPDPLSEMDYGYMNLPAKAEPQPHHGDAFLLQRDSCHLSGRHSAGLHVAHTTSPTQRQLFSSPIDDLLPLPAKALQTQTQLSKNFARISLHLDQIKGDAGECRYEARSRNDCCLSVALDDALVAGVAASPVPTTVAAPTSSHSLPSTLHHEHFLGRVEAGERTEAQASPTKITGAKPKRLSSFSTSSSTSSKYSSKSRTSLRSAYAPAPLFGSASFDERSVSCTEFRSSGGGGAIGPAALPLASNEEDGVALNSVMSTLGCRDFYANDDTCLDCLEKEFLANTIGKAWLQPSECARCRRRYGSAATAAPVPGRVYLGRSSEGVRCRSGSPTAFLLEVRDDCVYGGSGGGNDDFLASSSLRCYNKRDTWLSATLAPPMQHKRRDGLAKGRAENDLRTLNWNERYECGSGGGGGGDGVTVAVAIESLVSNQRRSKCDNYNGERLLKDILLTEPEIVTISTVNLTEETLVQALEKLHIAYNVELVKTYFRPKTTVPAAATNGTTIATTTKAQQGTKTTAREFSSMRHFLLHAAKQGGNSAKLRRLIALATGQQVNVQFKQDASIAHTAMVTVEVSDILEQWSHTSDLGTLKQLDERFVAANVLGKIANVIRQSQQQYASSSTRRALPERLDIPQYYASGYLTLSKKI